MMPGAGFVELTLTCSSREEAEKIADALLQRHLIACAKFIPVDSKYWWQAKVEEAHEVLLCMESQAKNFQLVEQEVAKLHSYDTFVLKETPITNLSRVAQVWLRRETQPKD